MFYGTFVTHGFCFNFNQLAESCHLSGEWHFYLKFRPCLYLCQPLVA